MTEKCRSFVVSTQSSEFGGVIFYSYFELLFVFVFILQYDSSCENRKNLVQTGRSKRGLLETKGETSQW